MGLNRLSSISSTSALSASSAVAFSYSYNQADQRITNTLADGSYWVYKYDTMGQVISGKKFFSDGIAVGGSQYEYSFDTIGNRQSAKGGTASSPSASYTANNLNQYTEREVPGVIDVTGNADAGATISVRDGTNTVARLANRHTDYYWRALDVDNTSSVFHTTNIQIRARKTVGSNSLVRAETRTAILPQTPEQFAYDADGNLTSDGLWSYTWDGENRLIAVESRSGAPAAFSKRLTFAYDHQGRRIRKQAESAYSGGSYSTTNVTAFMWDGWNIISEMQSGTGVPPVTNYYVWGLDLSGTLGGAGGVGGLLSMTRSSSSGTSNYYYCADGNGNVTDMVDVNGNVVAHYEYSPFGETLVAIGPMAAVNPWRFSTRYYDTETGLYMYPRRPYSPTL